MKETTEETTTAKGAEEAPLESGDTGKLDSFRQPTENGHIYGGESSSVQVQDGQVYHSWTFKLEDTADIVAETQITNNLDTVMYMYHREDNSGSWGRYIAKNDDHNRELRSRIELKEAKAGEYRVIVKPHKAAMRGNFSFSYACNGMGCESRFDPSQMLCSQDEFASKNYNATQSCMDKLAHIL